MSFQIEGKFPDVIEFTFEQVSFRIGELLELVNDGAEAHKELVVEISCHPACFEKMQLPIPVLPAKTRQPHSDITVDLKTDFFLKLPERTDAKIRVALVKGGEVLAERSAAVTLVPPQPRISMIYDRSINYAFQQNSIPVVKEMRLQNNGVPRKDLTFRLTTEPPFAQPVEVRLQTLKGGDEFRISPPQLDLKLSHDFLDGLKEKVSGWLKVEMVEGGEVVRSITEPIDLLARNEWCGLVSLPEILAAFVLPNDPAVGKILSRASDILKEMTGRSALNAYQDKNRKRSWEQIAAIYKAIGELEIRYIGLPASFETTGQKVRLPSDILSQRFGNCLDLSLLFAACCEQAGLRPFVFLHEGHAYAGCWLEERSMPEPAGDDLQQVRKDVELELLTVFEATAVTGGNPGTLNNAELLADSHLKKDHIFRLALDVHAARSARILPLPVAGQASSGHPAVRKVESAPGSTGLGEREFSAVIEISETGPAKPANRIDLWKSRLLDLSLRNRLLNFRDTKTTIRVLAEPDRFEDELAAERLLSLQPKPKLMSQDDPRDAVVYTHEQRADALKEHLQEELSAGRLHTHLEKDEHARRLTELFRSARNALDENGTNTLFATVGILEWRETLHSECVHRAPLLMVPVELKRKSVLEGFFLRRVDEETRLNFTLMEMLRQNFRKEINGLDPLPVDENGVDVSKVLRIVRDAVRDLSGWEVKPEVWLGQFSFTKFLLWKDLSDRLDDLKKNRVVRHLIEEAGIPFANPPGDVQAHELDDRFHPREILCPRSADSSQLAAVMAAADGHDFVLEGPPGTGKSQTITNIIAHCLAVGKRVLFVAEKRAALDVVHRRLREDGLEPFCLELHSNKTGKADVLAQFENTLKFVEAAGVIDWEHRAAELERLRDSLNGYTRALHSRFPCGLSAHHCLDYLIPRKDKETVALDTWSAILETSAETLDLARQVARQLQRRSQPLGSLEDHPLRPVEHEDWSPSWAERAQNLQNEIAVKCSSAIEATKELMSWLQCSRVLSREDLLRLDALVENLLEPEPVGSAFVTTPWIQLAQDLDIWSELAGERVGLRAALSPLYPPSVSGRIPLPCETCSDELTTAIFQKARELEILRDRAAHATSPVLAWLKKPNSDITSEQLRRLVDLAECLLESETVGPAFATDPWQHTAELLEHWILLVREREDLRSKINDYDEAKLLALDLDLLQKKCNKALTAWFFPKILNIGWVRKQLRLALPDKVKPDPLLMGEIVSTALRLREINNILGSVTTTAIKLLGQSWRDGEPKGDELSIIRAWGERLHLRLDRLASKDHEWREAMRCLLSEWFLAGASWLKHGSEVGKLLELLRDAVSAYDAASRAFIESAVLEQKAFDDASDHLTQMKQALDTFLGSAPRLRKINADFSTAAPVAQACLGIIWERGEPKADAIRKARAWGETLNTRLLAFTREDLVWLNSFRNKLSTLFAEGAASYGSGTTICDRFIRFRERLGGLSISLDVYASAVRLNRESIDGATDYFSAIWAMVEKISAAWSGIREWCSWQKVRHEAIGLGLSRVIQKIESASGATTEALVLFECSFRRALFFAILENNKALRNFYGSEHNENIKHFRDLDVQLAKLSCDMIRARLAAGVPRGHAADDISKLEIGLLRKEIGKRMRHIPVRQLINRIPTLLPRLKPCVLMSPLSVAQYLESSHETFDVVIFDEASQIPVWDAIGAIARGRQLIIVGDPKQLPPTSFFAASTDDEDDLTPDEHKDMESILDELMTLGLRHKRLRWHYRSRHEGLITFSNRQYYDNDLLTFPSPERELGGVRFHHIPDARYDKGKSRTNRIEAQTLVRELVLRLRDPSASRRSFGVVTFSQAQQALIENLLDEERSKYPEIECHFGDEPPVEGEPVFVKNLENVQGDERDVILFSICYGMDEAGKISMNFGPLNREGGERRLNVAVTRAKHEVIVFSGLRGEQIDLTRTQRRGVRDLKYFLEYAERGPIALVAATSGASLEDVDSEFERMVANRILEAGYDVHHQVGCSGYRIDLAVVDPSAPGRYLLGIECDGATYHRAATARDRDKLRQAVLEGLGWKLYRIWSTDWWHNADTEMNKLLGFISKITRD